MSKYRPTRAKHNKPPARGPRRIHPVRPDEYCVEACQHPDSPPDRAAEGARATRHAAGITAQLTRIEHSPCLVRFLVIAAALIALQAAGIEANVDEAPMAIDPAHEATVAWALREAVTNVVRHSGARTCYISLQAAGGVTALEVVDDGCGAAGEDVGTGLDGLARRIEALGGTFEAGPGEAGGFRVRVRLDAAAPARTQAEGPQ